MLFNTGRGTFANVDQVYAIIPATGESARRLKKICQEQNLYYTLTGGVGKTRSLLIFNNGMVMGSTLKPETLKNRANTELAILEAAKIQRRFDNMIAESDDDDDVFDLEEDDAEEEE